MKQDATYVVIGKVGSTYGVRGFLKIYPYAGSSDSILHYSPWFLNQGKNGWSIFKIEEGRTHGKGLIVKFVGIDTKEQASLQTGREIAIKRDQLPRLKKNEYYWSDLVGLSVIDQSGHFLGKVIDLVATGSNDVLIVKDQKEHAIPYLPGKVILQVDLTKQEILVDWEPI